MRLADFFRGTVSELCGLYPEREAASIVRLLCEERFKVPSYAFVTDPDREVEPLREDVTRLLAGEPLQYVIGKAQFCGRDFNVSPAVLIPRPETEELVAAAKSLAGGGARILDLCTGSGCIAWTLALDLMDVDVTALDISEAALEVARTQPFDADVCFVKGDLLGECSLDGPFDLIVSNPPYIMEKERAQMRRNVLDYEPGLALFVPDEDPMLFYRAIARWSKRLLAPGGSGFVEINETEGAAVLETFGEFSDVRLEKDLSGRDRFVRFQND